MRHEQLCAFDVGSPLGLDHNGGGGIAAGN
jgi:hypothetical protein